MSYAYYEHPIECPECGYQTHELVEVPIMHDQKVLMCEGCYTELLENEECNETRKTCEKISLESP